MAGSVIRELTLQCPDCPYTWPTQHFYYDPDRPPRIVHGEYDGAVVHWLEETPAPTDTPPDWRFDLERYPMAIPPGPKWRLKGKRLSRWARWRNRKALR